MMTMERLAEIESKDMKGKGISLQHNTTLKWKCNKGKQIQLGLLGEGGDIKGREWDLFLPTFVSTWSSDNSYIDTSYHNCTSGVISI